MASLSLATDNTPTPKRGTFFRADSTDRHLFAVNGSASACDLENFVGCALDWIKEAATRGIQDGGTDHSGLTPADCWTIRFLVEAIEQVNEDVIRAARSR